MKGRPRTGAELLTPTGTPGSPRPDEGPLELPLGAYHGHGSDGVPERIPSVARLYAVLLCAAGFGRARSFAVTTSPV
jgi:hypothetical protein